MSSEPIIEFQNVWKKYILKGYFHNSIREDIRSVFQKKDKDLLEENEFWALKDINLRINKAESVGIYGPNGSGKTTILKLIASVTYQTRGVMNVRGRVAPLIAIGAGFHKDLTGKENIYMNGSIIGMTLPEIKSNFDKIVDFAEIGDFVDMPIRRYSTGMVVRLGFSIAVHSKAEILLIDEILSVADKNFTDKCNYKLKELTSSEKTIIMVSHNLNKMQELTSQIIYIEQGNIVLPN